MALNELQKKNAAIIKAEAEKEGLKNKFVQDAILGIAYKESGLNPAASEVSYAGTKNARIREIFPTKTGKMSDAELDALKKDKEKFFNHVYAGIIGNGPGDGWRLRGRGFNQITGLDNYKAIKDSTGKDVVADPDLLSDPHIAAEAAIDYFKKGLEKGIKLGKFGPDIKSVNDFKDMKSAYNAVYHVNAGLGKQLYDKGGNIINDRTGGYKKGLDALAFFRGAIDFGTAVAKEQVKESVEAVKNNPKTTAAIVIMLASGIFLIIKGIS
jgi:predicted chitinase